MVLLTLDKPYTVHARSIDRNVTGQSPSNYKLSLRNAIKCNDHHYIRATLVSAKIPSTFYQIDSKNNSFTVGFNRPTFVLGQQYSNLVVQDPEYKPLAGTATLTSGSTIVATTSDLRASIVNNRIKFAEQILVVASVSSTQITLASAFSGSSASGQSISTPYTRNDYERTVKITIAKGNYDINTLLAEIKTKLNSACTTAGNFTSFRTFFRSQDPTAQLYKDDLADAGGQADYTKDYVLSTPQFDWYYSTSLNKVRLFRTDTGGKMALGKWDIQTEGVKLGMALGFNHITAQQLRDLNLDQSVKTSVENSLHYRETTLTEYNDFTILNPTNSATYLAGDKRRNQYGHSVLSVNCVNMFANDSVYLRISNVPSNAYDTLYGGLTNVMAVIPMYSGSSTENFYSPSNVISTVVGSAGVSELDVRLTDAFGEELDFNGVENEFMLVFEAFADGTRPDKPPEQNFAERNAVNQFRNLHRNIAQRSSVLENR